MVPVVTIGQIVKKMFGLMSKEGYISGLPNGMENGTVLKSTHKFIWNSNSIFFKSFYGHHYTQPENSYIIHNWSYTGENIPEPTGLKPHINLWLDKGNQPTDNEEIEIIIDRFEYREKEPWLENPQFIGCVHHTGKKEKKRIMLHSKSAHLNGAVGECVDIRGLKRRKSFLNDWFQVCYPI